MATEKTSPGGRLKKMIKALLVGLGLLVIGLGGLVVWLRSDSGASFVYGRLSGFLAKEGYTFQAAEFKGPLPGRLLVREAVLSDREGLIAKVALLEVDIRLAALLSREVHVSLIQINDPELLRLPVFPPSPEEEADSGPFTLPVGLRLDQLIIYGGQVQPEALASLGFKNPRLSFQSRASGRLDGEKVGLDLSAQVAEGTGHELASALIKLETEGQARPDRLTIKIKVDDQPGGLLSAMLANPDWPGLNLSLDGQGELTDWLGTLSLAAGNFGDLQADLNYQGRSGQVMTDLVEQPDWKVRLEALAASGSAWPEPLVQSAGNSVSLTAEGGRQGQSVRAALDLSGLELSPPASLKATVEGLLGAGGGTYDLKAALRGFKPDSTASTLDLDLAAGLELNSRQQKVQGLRLTAPGLNLEAEATRGVESGALAGDFDLRLADGSPLVAEGLRLAGLKPDDYGGALHLSGRADWRGSAEAASGQLKVSGQNLRWPTDLLTRLLGPTLDLDLKLAGGGGEAFELDIDRAEAGELSLAGRASYQPADDPADSALEADLRAGLKNLAAISPGVTGPVNLELAGRGRLSDLTAGLTLTSPELVAGPGSLNQAEIKAQMAGRLYEPGSSLAAPELYGQFNLAVSDSPGGPLALKADWEYKQTPEENFLKVDDLEGDLAGLDLSGNLSADLSAGQQSLAGGLKAEVGDWAKLSALTGLAISGQPAHLLISLEPQGDRQAARAELDLPALKINTGPESLVDLRGTALTFTAVDLYGRPDLNLNLDLGSGRAGPAAWSQGTITASGQAGQGLFDGEVRGLELSGAGGGRGDGLSFSGRYELAAARLVDLEELSLNLGSSGLALNEPLRLSLAPQVTVSPFSASFKPRGSLRAEADLTPGSMRIKADLENLPYSFIQTFAGPAVPDGEIQSLTVDLAEGPSGLTGDFALKTQAAPRELKNIRPVVDLTGTLGGGPSPSLDLKANISGGPGWRADGDMTAVIPLTRAPGGGFPQPDMNGPLSASLKFMGPVDPIWSLLDQADRTFSGELLLEAQVGGSLSQPVPQGSAWLDKGRFEDNMYGLLISDIKLEAHSTPELPLRALLSAKDGRDGDLAVEGQITDLSDLNLTAKGVMSRFSPIHRDDLIVFISGDFGADGPVATLNINSNLTMDRGEMDLRVVSMANSIPTLPITGPEEQLPPSAIAGMPFDLKIRIPNQFFIRGYGLECEWQWELTIGGDSLKPSIIGSLAPVRGYFEFYAKEFQFTGGDISFNGGTTPILNLELTYSGPTITAIIKAMGSANNPQISLESRPPMPRDEILSQVLFGKSASSISRFEAIQLAAAVRDLTNFGSRGGLDALGTVRSSLGLDVLRLGGSENDRQRRASELTGSMAQEIAGNSASREESDDFSVEAGKYINDNVYLGLEHSGVSGAAVRVEIELRPNVSVEARTSQESSRVGIGWKKDY